MARQKRDLYEILASRRKPMSGRTIAYGHRKTDSMSSTSDTTETSLSASVAANQPVPGSENYTGPVVEEPEQAPASAAAIDPEDTRIGPTDLVVTSELALAIFVVAAVMVGTAFYIGYDRGRNDTISILQQQAKQEQEKIETVTGVSVPDGFSEHRPDFFVPENTYVMRITMHEKTVAGLSRARADRDYAAKSEILKEIPVHAFLMENDATYSVCLGPLTNRFDKRFDDLKRGFLRLSGPPTSTESRPYKAPVVEKAGKLGKLCY